VGEDFDCLYAIDLGKYNMTARIAIPYTVTLIVVKIKKAVP
jgi:hypothetical protein